MPRTAPSPGPAAPRPAWSPRSLRDLGRWLALGLARRPWVARALRTTGAAVLAWVLVGLVPGPWSDYPYYAPLGAVIATSATVHASARRSAQAVLAIALGVVVARVTDALALPELAGLAVVVLAGVLLSGWPLLGDSGSWVPTSALFALVIGATDPVGYVSAYVGLTLAGALIGVGVNLLVPPLPLTPAERALDRLRTATAEHLDALAAAVRDDGLPLPGAVPLRAVRAATTAAVADAREAARGNWTARHYRSWRERQDRHAAALDRAAEVALDVRRAVETARTVTAADAARAREETSPVVPFAVRAGDDERGAALRESTAAAVAAGAALVRVLGTEDGADDEAVVDDAAATLAAALDAVQESVAADRASAGGWTRPADGVVVALTPLLTG